jgi:Cu(I)/Ag(I) efflux system membrane fusion protein
VLRRVEKAHAEKAAPDSELEDARFNAALGELQVELDRLEQTKARGRYEEARLRLERMRLLGPIDGTVERLLAREGQSVEAAKGVIRVVCTDPLWVDAPVPVAMARRLAVGAPAAVRFASRSGDGPSATGKVVRIASVADAASETLEVRVELANPSARPAGEQVAVSFPAGNQGR